LQHAVKGLQGFFVKAVVEQRHAKAQALGGVGSQQGKHAHKNEQRTDATHIHPLDCHSALTFSEPTELSNISMNTRQIRPGLLQQYTSTVYFYLTKSPAYRQLHERPVNIGE
jgi:hypothetical protein